MPKLSGIEVATRAHKLDPPPCIIILSVHGDESYIMRALGSGARAYLLKNATDEDLIPAIRAVAAGKPSSVLREQDRGRHRQRAASSNGEGSSSIDSSRLIALLPSSWETGRYR
jgi:DNA-binding NarL/FixJ family response regulator